MENRCSSLRVAVIIVLTMVIAVVAIGYYTILRPKWLAKKARAAKTAEAPPASEAKGGPKPGMLTDIHWDEDRLPNFVQVRFRLDKPTGEYNYDRDPKGIPIWLAHGVFYFAPRHGDSVHVECGDEVRTRVPTENGTFPCWATWRIWNGYGDAKLGPSGSITLPDAQEFQTPGGPVWIRRICWFEPVNVNELP